MIPSTSHELSVSNSFTLLENLNNNHHVEIIQANNLQLSNVVEAILEKANGFFSLSQKLLRNALICVYTIFQIHSYELNDDLFAFSLTQFYFVSLFLFNETEIYLICSVSFELLLP